MKRLLTILFVFVSYLGISQSVVNRAGASNTVKDMRWIAGLNMFVPEYLDTAVASTQKGIDSVAIIYTFDVDNLWYRSLQPYRHWVPLGTGASGLPVLPDGVYSGGNVAWSGTGLIFNVSPASYVLNGIAYAYAGGTITLPAADPTFARIDVIILDSTGASFVAGVPSATPQEPSVNPQTQIRRAIVTIPANSLTPAIQTNVLFDENLSQPSEWDATSNGTVVFGNTNFPYHLTIAMAVTGFTGGQYILLSNDSTYNSSQQGSMVIFYRGGGVMAANQNININLRDASGNIVGLTLSLTNYGLNRNLVNAYQAIIIPMPDFGAANLSFNQVYLTASGSGTLPQFNMDYIQFQNGFTQVFSQQNAITSVVSDNGIFNATTPNSTITITGINGLSDSISGGTLFLDGKGFIKNQTIFDGTLPNIQHANFAIDSSGFIGYSFRVLGTSGTFNGPLFSVNKNGDGIVRAITFFTGNYSNQGGASIFDGTVDQRIQLTGGVFFKPVNNPAIIKVANPNSTSGGLVVTDIFDGLGPNAFYRILDLQRSDTSVLYVNKGGQIHSADSTVYVSGGIDLLGRNRATGNYELTTVAGGSVTSIGFNTATGIRSTAEPLTSTGTIRIDTTVIATRLYVQTFGTFYNTNVGSSYRFAIPNTNTIKTLRVLNGILADSATANTISIQVDSSVYATKGFVASVAGGGGFTGVTTVSVVNANGFNGSVANPTTTPAITITTTATGVLKGNGTAISAATSGTDFSAGTSGLATGILKSTTTTGALTIAVAGDFPTLNQNTTGTAATITGISTVPHGGTGLSTLTAFGLMAAGTTTTGNMQQVGIGTAGQVLTSNGAGALPTFQAVSVSSGVSSLTSLSANRIILSGSTGAITITTPQDINTTSQVTFQRGTFAGAAATANLILSSHTDPTAAAGILTNDGTRLAFSLGTTYKRFIFSNDVTPTAGQGLFGNGTDFTVGSYTAADNGMVVTPSATGVTFKTNSTPQTLTTGATITWNVANGENANLTLANTGATLNLTNPVAGHTYVIQITQGTGGSRTITTWPAGTIWPSGTAPVLGTAVGARNLISLYYNGTSFFGAFNPNIYQ